MKNEKHLIILVPGFLGWGQVGSFPYFNTHNKRVKQNLRKHGIIANAMTIEPLPTSALPERAYDLLVKSHRKMKEGGYSKVHFIGHSTGGLDIRFALDPNVKISGKRRRPRDIKLMREELRASLGARITVATPHRGTPLAAPFYILGFGFSTSVFNEITGSLSGGSIPLESIMKIFGNHRLPGNMNLKRWAGMINLAGMTPEDVARVVKYAFSIAVDRRAIKDLTPDHVMKLGRRQKNMGADTRHCYSIITMAPPPEPENMKKMKNSVLDSPMYLVYSILWSVTGYYPSPRPFEPMSRHVLRRLGLPPGKSPGPHDSDGVVPTLSQPWGKVIGLVEGDHLDVMGHPGMITCGDSFNKRKFNAMLDKVADCIKAAS